MTTPLELRADNVSLGYDTDPVLRDLTFDVAPGEVLGVVGASGCGKSTLLRALAGLLPVRSGRLLAGDVPISGPGSERALVHQQDALLPWRTARRNVELPLAIRGTSRAERRARSTQWLAQVDLSDHARRLPAQLSGGMRQRVQLARALAAEPSAIFMDEPFGSLDTQTRVQMHRLLATVHARCPATIVFVTHDVAEAVAVSDRIAVLQPHRLTTVVDCAADARRNATATAAAEADLRAALETREHVR